MVMAIVSRGTKTSFFISKETDFNSKPNPLGAFLLLFSSPANLSKTCPFQPLFCLPVSKVVILKSNANFLKSWFGYFSRFEIALILVIEV